MNAPLRATALACILLATPTAPAADWPNWRGPNHDGISTETTWSPDAVGKRSVAWEAEVGVGYPSIAVANGMAYTVGNFNKNTDRISCFDETTGKLVWKFEYPEPLAAKFYSGGCSATPTIHNGKLYFASKSGKVFCLDATTGKPVWKAEFGTPLPTWGFASSALILGQAALFNAGSHGIAYDAATGKILWKSGNDVAGYATPVPFDHQGKKAIALFTKNALTAVDPENGKVLWSYPWQTQHDVNAADPVLFDQKAFITSGYGRGCALIDLSGDTPKKLWENKNMRSHMSGPVLIDGYLYGFDDNRLACLDWKTGATQWEEKSPRKGALMAAGKHLIILGETGRLAIAEANPKAYRELAATQAVDGQCWTMPVLANGQIHTRSAEGKLVVLKAK